MLVKSDIIVKLIFSFHMLINTFHAKSLYGIKNIHIFMICHNFISSYNNVVKMNIT